MPHSGQRTQRAAAQDRVRLSAKDDAILDVVHAARAAKHRSAELRERLPRWRRSWKVQENSSRRTNDRNDGCENRKDLFDDRKGMRNSLTSRPLDGVQVRRSLFLDLEVVGPAKSGWLTRILSLGNTLMSSTIRFPLLIHWLHYTQNYRFNFRCVSALSCMRAMRRARR